MATEGLPSRLPWRRSLKARLLLSYLAVTLLVLATVDFLALTYLERSALSHRREASAEHARVVAGASSQYILKGHAYLEYIARDYGHLAEARVLILDGQGRVLEDSFYDNAMLNTSLSDHPTVVAALAGRATTRLQSLPHVGQVLYAGAPVLQGNTVYGAVLVAQQVESVYTGLAPVRNTLLLVSGAALVLAAVVGRLLAGSLVRPVTLITAGVKAVEAGDLSSQVQVAGRDELARLAQAFNGMAERISKSEASRRAFVADAAHELRTPLAALQALVEPLLTGAVTQPDEQAEFLQDIGHEVERLAALAADLLTLSELEAGRPLQRAPVDVLELLSTVRTRLLPLAREKAVTLEIAARPGLALPADGLKLERALYNLADNGIRYSQPGGTVRLSGEPASGGARITVSDQGPGIPAEALPHIFERFYRSERSRSRERGGAGLGLAIARGIIAGHGGRIWVESKAGEGTQFVVQMPGD